MLRLVLWDIDHTLIENAGVSKAIYFDRLWTPDRRNGSAQRSD